MDAAGSGPFTVWAAISATAAMLTETGAVIVAVIALRRALTASAAATRSPLLRRYASLSPRRQSMRGGFDVASGVSAAESVYNLLSVRELFRTPKGAYYAP